MTETSGPTLGVTLFSFTNEWQQRRFTLEQLVASVAELGLGPGIEAVGFQSFRDFPRISDACAERWRELLARHGLDLGRVGWQHVQRGVDQLPAGAGMAYNVCAPAGRLSRYAPLKRQWCDSNGDGV